MTDNDKIRGVVLNDARRGLAVVLALAGGLAGPVAAAELRDCQALTDAAERLRCYDELARQPAEAGSPVLDQRLQKERDLARRAFAVLPHRPSYLLHSYMHEPNVAPFAATDPQTDFQHAEIKFQISLRVPMWNKAFGDNGDLWLGYTQVSYWQAYHSAQSAPFRETNYEPELGLSFDTDFPLLGLRHRRFSLGFAHQSNGRGDALSRSWNRVWADFELERGNFALQLKPWYRLRENPVTDDNPDLADYAGRGELRLGYKFGDQVFTLTLHNSLRAEDNRSGYQLDWSFPYSKRIKGLLQFTNGYGESLVDYNVRMRRVGLGVLVEDWL